MPLTYADVSRTGDEREVLTTMLDWQRDTLATKCDGLSDEQLMVRSCPPSTLSLLGLMRHLTDVERWWFRIRFQHEELPLRFSNDERPDDDFDALDSVPAQAVRDAWLEECAMARDIVAKHELDDSGDRADGTPVSLRWILNHMVEEYSRHNGHADLLRQAIDGATGY
ncbi:MAG: DinB family protein [Solirubrobacterales bacterium]|nr:DinB family protein [Solirubrobacterales bacterium]